MIRHESVLYTSQVNVKRYKYDWNSEFLSYRPWVFCTDIDLLNQD